ncbi:KIN family protein [Megaselia abdita]
MGKAEAGTPKYLANKMKAKGLQKLRWYCQMCQKQCRDDNGFKCHIQSEAHQRQLLLFADSPGKFLHNFSKEFTDGFMDIVRRRHSSKRVKANKVYQEYIACKDHIHMNSTRWLSLSEYVKWLGRSGQCVVDETEEGWYIQYIDRSPEAREAQEKKDRKEKADKDDQERMMEFIEKQVERARKEKGEEDEAKKFTELKRENEEEPLKLDLKLTSKIKPEPVVPMQNLLKRTREEDDKIFKKPKPTTSKSCGKSALDEIREQEEAKKEKQNRKDYWLAEGIVVKFVDRSLGEKFYKQKAVVREVIDKYQAKIKFLETGEKVKVDQSHLETVIPALEKPVRVVNGAYRGSEAVLKELNEKKFCVTIEISRGTLKGRILENVEYEDICKIDLD